MSAQNLVVQLSERLDSDKRVSFNITYVPIERGVVVDSPVVLWQRETPGGDVPQALPFVAEVTLGVRQFRDKEGKTQSQAFVQSFGNARPVVLDV
jgi:hypothetical protein